jgi:hypothetical protein
MSKIINTTAVIIMLGLAASSFSMLKIDDTTAAIIVLAPLVLHFLPRVAGYAVRALAGHKWATSLILLRRLKQERDSLYRGLSTRQPRSLCLAMGHPRALPTTISVLGLIPRCKRLLSPPRTGPVSSSTSRELCPRAALRSGGRRSL